MWLALLESVILPETAWGWAQGNQVVIAQGPPLPPTHEPVEIPVIDPDQVIEDLLKILPEDLDPDSGLEDEVLTKVLEALELLEIIAWRNATKGGFGEAWAEPNFFPYDFQGSEAWGPSMGEIASSPLRLLAFGLRMDEKVPGFKELGQFDQYAKLVDSLADTVETEAAGELLFRVLILGKAGRAGGKGIGKLSDKLREWNNRRRGLPNQTPGAKNDPMRMRRQIQEILIGLLIGSGGTIGEKAGEALELQEAREEYTKARQQAEEEIERIRAEQDKIRAELEQALYDAYIRKTMEEGVAGLTNGTIYGPFQNERGFSLREIEEFRTATADAMETIAVWMREKRKQGKYLTVMHGIAGTEIENKIDKIKEEEIARLSRGSESHNDGQEEPKEQA